MHGNGLPRPLACIEPVPVRSGAMFLRVLRTRAGRSVQCPNSASAWARHRQAMQFSCGSGGLKGPVQSRQKKAIECGEEATSEVSSVVSSTMVA